MSKLIKNKKILVVIVLIYMFVIGQIAQAFAGEPGSSSDPLVTKSYIDNRLDEMRLEINAMIAELDTGSSDGSTTDTSTVDTRSSTSSGTAGSGDITVSDDILAEIENLNKRIDIFRNDLIAFNEELKILKSGENNRYKIIEVEEGSLVNFGESTEFIVRAGESTAIAGSMGGLADITAGVDLKTGELIQNNHYIIVSRDDGRGLKAISKLYILIKGTYTLID